MNKETIRNRIEEIGIVPAIRLSSAEEALFAAVARRKPEFIVGAGTTSDIETAQRCVDAGARFLTSPGLDIQLVEFAVKHDLVVFPGALTPSEIMAAWKAGSDFVKVFPCSLMGGPTYIKSLRSPLPEIPLIASGGVTQQTAADFILAGAVAVGIGRDLINPEAVHRRDSDWIRELSGRFLRIINDARSQKAA